MENNKNNSNLVIYQKYLEFISYTNDIVRKYPKSETFCLVKEIKGSLYSGFRLLMYAIKKFSKQEKLKYLSELGNYIYKTEELWYTNTYRSMSKIK